MVIKQDIVSPFAEPMPELAAQDRANNEDLGKQIMQLCKMCKDNPIECIIVVPRLDVKGYHIEIKTER